MAKITGRYAVEGDADYTLPPEEAPTYLGRTTLPEPAPPPPAVPAGRPSFLPQWLRNWIGCN